MPERIQLPDVSFIAALNVDISRRIPNNWKLLLQEQILLLENDSVPFEISFRKTLFYIG